MSLHKAYCMADLLLRLKMNKYFPTIFSAPVIYLLQDPEYSYSDCLKAYHATSTKLLVAFSGAVVAVAALVHWWHS